uniref:Uncharacterized protein n=1 Tax=Neogobius melanostomus TaxID=47308 RepID=A0A8C6SQ02_9GOBI
MDSLMSLGSPLKQFTSCMTRRASPHKRGGSKRSESVRRTSLSRSRRVSVGRRRSVPCTSQKVPDSWLRVYQDELKKERKRQQAILAKKNAERTVRKTHFRKHHCLPRQTTTPRKPAPTAKDESFFGAFQGLSLDGLMGGNTAPQISVGAVGDPCKVM